MLKTFRTVKDYYSFAITEPELTHRTVGELLRSPVQTVPYHPLLDWKFQWYPAGEREDERGYVSVFVHVATPVSLFAHVKIMNTDYNVSFYNNFTKTGSIGVCKFIKHDVLRTLFIGGRAVITCDIEFMIECPMMELKHSLSQSCDHFPPDFSLVVQGKSIMTHKYLLCLLSPVFHAMFTHDTTESNTQQLIVVDFSFEVVQAVINYFFNSELNRESPEIFVGILRFADKYDIKVLELEKHAFFNLSQHYFAEIAHYAYDCSKTALISECVDYLENNIQQLQSSTFFLLPPPVIIYYMKAAFSLGNDIDVLRYSQRCNVENIKKHLEKSMMSKLTLQTFCQLANYAWDCSREEIQLKCAEFFHKHRIEITTLTEFVFLKGRTIQGLLQTALLFSNTPHL